MAIFEMAEITIMRKFLFSFSRIETAVIKDFTKVIIFSIKD